MTLFSKRKKLADMAVEWCHKQNSHADTFNIVTALDSLGVLKDDSVITPSVKKGDIKNTCIDCGDEWDAVNEFPCPHCGNECPF